MSTKATSGVRLQTRRRASAVVAAGPATSAPHDSSSIFNPVPTSQESSTTRTHKSLSTKGLALESQRGDEVIRYRASVSDQLTVLHSIPGSATHREGGRQRGPAGKDAHEWKAVVLPRLPSA